MRPDASEIFARSLRRIHDSTDRMMLVILLSQWAFAILLAFTLSPYVESLSLIDLMEDAIRFNTASCERHSVEIVRDFDELATVEIDRHKLFQIIMNVLNNARHAVMAVVGRDRRIVIRLERREPDQVAIEIEDNGCGIPAENLTKIFSHGFTTKADGHGFGLHSSACSAMELGGALTAHSDGPGRGAIFTLVIPCVTAAHEAGRLSGHQVA